MNQSRRVGLAVGVAGILFASCGGEHSNSDLNPGADVAERIEQLTQVPPNGGVVTLAGTGTRGATDATNAVNGTLNDPAGVAVGPDGTIYVADWGNNSIRRIKPDGSLDTFLKGRPNLIKNPRAEQLPVTSPGIPEWTDEGNPSSWIPATRSQCQSSSCGYPYDGSRVFWTGTHGQISQVIPASSLAPYAANIAAGKQQFHISVRQRAWMPSASATLTVSYLRNDGSGNEDQQRFWIKNAASVAWSSIADRRLVPTDTAQIKVRLASVDSENKGQAAFDQVMVRALPVEGEGQSVDAGLIAPTALAFAPNGDLYIGGAGLWIASASGGFSVVSPTSEYLPPNQVSSISIVSDGTVYIADPTQPRLRVRSPSGTLYYAEVTGLPNEEPIAVAASPDTGPLGGHKLWIAFRSYFTAYLFNCPTTAVPVGATVTCTYQNQRVGRQQGFVDDVDGTPGGEKLGYPHSLALGRLGELLIGDEGNHAVRRALLPFTLTSAGTGAPGFVDGASSQAQFFSPNGIVATADGGIVIADRMNNRVRKIVCGGTNVCDPSGDACAKTAVDDGNACTTDTCAVVAVRHDPTPSGSPCSDGNACTGTSGADTCNSGTCVPGPSVPTDDGLACTIDSCDPASGPVHTQKTFPDSDLTDCMVPACNPANGNAQSVIAPEGTSCGAPNSGRQCDHAATCETAAPPLVAPSLPAGATTSFGDATGFIYEGTGNVQTGVTAGYVDKTHAGWLVGYVKTAAGNPMANVIVTVVGNANYGQSLSRGDGRFDLVVNGGTTHTLRFTKPGHFTVDRRIYVGWEQTAALEDVVLLTPDTTNGTSITAGSTVQQVAIGSTNSGTGTDMGTRTPVVVVPSSTKVFIDGAERTAPITLRLTEYTAGPDGMKRMPAPLATGTGYTYAVEISADEALSAGRVDFKDGSGNPKDVFFYLEDFIGFGANVGACITQCQGAAACIDACRSVPTGYYDRDKAAWIPSASGRLIKITSTSGGVAAVDVTGDGVADAVLTDPQFSTLGFTNAELSTLGGRYTTGASLWRVPINHMTPWDCNWPVLPPDCEGGVCPTPPPPPPSPPLPGCGGGGGPGQASGDTTRAGSIIGCDSQTLGEKADVAGTPYTLNYNSRRMSGFSDGRRLTVALTGPHVHSKALVIKLLVSIAGQRHETEFTNLTPNMTWDFTWDGLDAAGRKVVGASVAAVTVTTYYQGKYTPSGLFGAYPSVSAALTASPRAFYAESTNSSFSLAGAAPDQAWSLGGWTFDQQHFYNRSSNTVWLGTGGTRPARARLPTITRVASGLSGATDIAVAPNGDIFFTDPSANRIKKVSTSGVITTVVGDGATSCPGGTGPSKLGTPNDNPNDATLAHLYHPQTIALGPDESLYIGGWEQTVRKATPRPDGKYSITTVAGVACRPGDWSGVGENGPATSALLGNPSALAVGPDGAFYVGEDLRVRRVDSTGTIKTVAGNGSGADDRSNEGKLASTVPAAATAADQYGIAVARDGTLYIASGYTLETVDPNGRLHYLNRVFNPDILVKDGVPLNTQPMGLDLDAVAIRPDGSVAFNDDEWQRHIPPGQFSHQWIRLLDKSGIVTSIASTNEQGLPIPDQAIALGNGPGGVRSLEAAPDGSILALADGTLYRITEPEGNSASNCNDSSAKYQVAGDAEQDYCFDANGRHLRTIDARTGQPVTIFEYTAGQLTGITDRAGQKTTIAKLTGPDRYEITAPFLQKTTVTLDDATGYAKSIKDKLGELQLSPLSDGFLDNLHDRRGSLFDFTFDSATGLLTSDASPLGPQLLSRTQSAGTRRVTHTSPQLRITQYETTLDAARVVKHTTTFPDLSTEVRQSFPNSLERRTAPDGTVSEASFSLDLALGGRALFPSRTTITLPSQLVKTTQEQHSVPVAISGGMRQVVTTLQGPSSTAPASTLTRDYSVTGTDLPGFSSVAQKLVAQSAAGRQTTRLLDKVGRLRAYQVGNLTPVVFNYEELATAEHRGSLKNITQGNRITSFEYQNKGSSAPDNAGYLLRKTTPDGVTEFDRDVFGRVTTQLEAKAAAVAGTTALTWDANGNLQAITPPSTKTTPPQHALGYNEVNLLTSYTPPGLAGIFDSKTTYSINADRLVDSETQPKQLSTSTPVVVTRTYVTNPTKTDQVDIVSFPAGTGYPAGSVNHDYFNTNTTTGSAAGRISSIAGPYGVGLAFLYDGQLLKKATWSGELAGSIEWTYNDRFLHEKETVLPAPTLGSAFYTSRYDADDLVTCISPSSTTPCNPATSSDLVLTRSSEHGAVTDIAIGTSSAVTVKEHIEYSDTTADKAANQAFAELRSQVLKLNDTTQLASLIYDTANDPRDGLGRISTKIESFGSGPIETVYHYDERGRLEEVETGGLPEIFGYDPNGNRTIYTPAVGSALVGTYDDQDRLLTYGTAAGTSAGDMTFAYGPNGELKSKTVKTATASETWTYAYDPLGNLVTVTKPGTSTTTYTYIVDGLGRRVGKKEKIGTGATTLKQRWLYKDALNPVAELDATGAVVARYVYGSRRNVPDLVIKGGQVYRLFVDQLGSPRMAVNVANSTDVPYRVDYSAFGVATWKGSGAEAFDWIPFGFAGGIYDKDTRLVRFGARDYDPTIGRWVSKDPIRFDGDDPNLYAYVANEPINRSDPSGLTPDPFAPSGSSDLGDAEPESCDGGPGKKEKTCPSAGYCAKNYEGCSRECVGRGCDCCEQVYSACNSCQPFNFRKCLR